MVVATLFSVLGKFPQWLVNCIVDPIKFQFQCLFCYNNNIKTLRDEVNTLENIRKGVKLSVAAAERNIEVIAPTVRNWLTIVEENSEEANEILEQTTEVEMGCLTGLCPNPASHYWWSRKAMETIRNIRQLKLKEEGDKYSKLAYPGSPKQMVSVSTEGIKSFESRKSTENQVMDALLDNKINMIGICGMGGLGKTTMVEDIAKRARVENIFDEVAMTIVSINQDLIKIQGDLASMLDLELKSESSLRKRADRLFSRLSNGKRILVILDDVWEELDLGKIGIPFRVDRKGCKIVLTSRNEHVCVEMGSTKNFTVQVLTGDEGWDLFKEVAEIDNGTNELQFIAKDVADECKGLPLAIVTLAKALKNAREHSWNDTLRQLRRCNEMPKKVELSIELSYNMLKREEAKPLLLLCSLFPEDSDIPIECLVRYAVGLRLLNQIETVAAARNLVNTLIDHLKSCYLILGGGEETVRLHDVVRDVCILITSKDKGGYLVRCDAGLTEWPQVASFKDYTTISFKFDDLERFPAGLDCPNLKLLQVQCKHAPRYNATNESCTRFDSIDFFEGMKELKVVGLRSMFLQLPPQPLKSLLNIQTLCLDFCRLDTITSSMIGSLKSLRILSFFKSYIKELPSEIGQLEHLQILDLRFVGPHGGISPNILSKLDKLEELYAGDNDVNACIAKLNSMSYLNTLDIHLSLTAMLKLKHFRFDNLRRFCITIGSPLLFNRSEGYGLQNSLSLNDCDWGMLYDFGIKVLLKRSKHVLFECLKGLGRNIFDALDVDDSVRWEELSVARCDELEYLMCGDIPVKTFAFGKLQILKLEYLPAMKGLFPESMVKCLTQLQKLDLSQCEKMEYIVAKEGGEDEKDSETIVFPKLKYLSLEDLDMLRSFCSNSNILFPKQVLLPNLEKLYLNNLSVVHIVDYRMQGGSFHKPRGLDASYCEKDFNVVAPSQQKLFPNLQLLHVEDCCKLEAVFNFEGLTTRRDHAEVTLGPLESLELHNLPKLMHVWRMVPKELQDFQNLTVITIWQCDSLRYLFSPTMAKLLGNLMFLWVHECKMMEKIIDSGEDLSKIKILDEIVTAQEEEQMIGDKILFPQLKWISLKNLENLNCFCSGNCEFQFSSLNELYISGCPNMKTFCSGPLSTGKLGVGSIYIGGQGFWTGDLNTTIQNASKLLNHDHDYEEEDDDYKEEEDEKQLGEEIEEEDDDDEDDALLPRRRR